LFADGSAEIGPIAEDLAGGLIDAGHAQWGGQNLPNHFSIVGASKNPAVDGAMITVELPSQITTLQRRLRRLSSKPGLAPWLRRK